MQTQAQIFAAEYAKTLAAGMLRTIRLVRLAANIIMVIAMVVSYSHQAHYLVSIGASPMAAWSIPGALDSLTFLCVKVLATAAVVKGAKVAAGLVLVLPVGVSGAVNFIAPGAQLMKLVYVATVLLIPAAEIVASRIKPDFAAMDAMERKLQVEQPTLTVAELEAVAALPEAPVSPAPVRRVGRPPIPAAAGQNGRMVHAQTGEPLATRTESRKRNGK